MYSLLPRNWAGYRVRAYFEGKYGLLGLRALRIFANFSAMYCADFTEPAVMMPLMDCERLNRPATRARPDRAALRMRSSWVAVLGSPACERRRDKSQGVGSISRRNEVIPKNFLGPLCGATSGAVDAGTAWPE